jgi:hypothetical protein
MSKKNLPDGFEEFAHSINELSPNERQELKKTQDKYQSFELYSFLEEEVHRLEAMNNALEQTSFVLNKYSQEKNILKLKRTEAYSEVNNFTEALTEPKNNFWRSLKEIFNDSF